MGISERFTRSVIANLVVRWTEFLAADLAGVDLRRPNFQGDVAQKRLFLSSGHANRAQPKFAFRWNPNRTPNEFPDPLKGDTSHIQLKNMVGPEGLEPPTKRL